MRVAPALLMAICSVQAAAQCTKDTDCKGDRICASSGVCTSPRADPKRSGAVTSQSTKPQAKATSTAAGPCDLLYVGLQFTSEFNSAVGYRIVGIGTEKASYIYYASPSPGVIGNGGELSCLTLAKMAGRAPN